MTQLHGESFKSPELTDAMADRLLDMLHESAGEVPAASFALGVLIAGNAYSSEAEVFIEDVEVAPSDGPSTQPYVVIRTGESLIDLGAEQFPGQ